MLTAKSEYLLKKGKVISIGAFHPFDMYPGEKWIVKYRGRYYSITDDGTGNGFWDPGDPWELDREEALRRVLEAHGVEEGKELIKEIFGEELNDDEVDEILGF